MLPMCQVAICIGLAGEQALNFGLGEGEVPGIGAIAGTVF